MGHLGCILARPIDRVRVRVRGRGRGRGMGRGRGRARIRLHGTVLTMDTF